MADPSQVTGVGILGLGVYLPPDVRRNDWWSPEVVAQWANRGRAAPPPITGDLSAGARRVIEAVRTQVQDPFQGAVERRVLAPSLTHTDMEANAAREAIDRSGIDPHQINLLLTHTVAPEYQLSNPAAVLHARLGLAPACFSAQIEAAAYSFLMQLSIAEAMIASGRARYALLVQSAVSSRLMQPDDPVSPYFGDGATAVVVGPVQGRGLCGSVHYTDGRYPRTIIAGVPGSTWYDEGRAVIHVGDPVGLGAVLMQTVDLCKTSVDAVLESTKLSPDDIDFFCIHQGTSWLRQIAQEFSGLGSAATIETFASTGYLFSAIMPLGLRMATDAGTLAPGDLVLLFGGGTGMTYGATVIQWGRA